MSHHNDTLTPTSTPPPLTSTSPDTNTNTTTPNKPHRTTLAAEKKRLRDRRAQQTLRDKKLRHTRALEEQVAALQEKVAICEQYHADTDNGVGRLLQCIDNLRRRNEVLVKRQRALRGLVGEWEREDSAQLGQEGWSEDALVSGPALENAYGHGAEKVSRNGYNVNGSHEARLSSLPPPHTNSTSTTAAKFHLNPVSTTPTTPFPQSKHHHNDNHPNPQFHPSAPPLKPHPGPSP
ncbi:hypothetical protein BJY01DRAFT_255896 [Aspergillus pseudoustus]|uniref:BZIP domain-containing protein n=1 Tax=Aspergillus pseudoustus TaxID=1810923 RepID=A0ABR4IG63_9EURO